MLKSGRISVSSNNQNFFQLTVLDNIIDFNILDKKFFKELLDDSARITSFRNLIKSIKELAEELRNQETTISISYQGEKILTIGSMAQPKVSQFFTRTTGIQIDNLRKLVQLRF
jgi:spermidine/putrescine-binding protein